MDDTRFGGVVGSLHLREVHNVPAHRRGSNEATVCEVLQLVSVDIGTLLLLASPNVGSRSGAVESSVKVGCDDVSVVFELTLGHGALSPWDSRVGYENVKTAIELLDGCGYSFLDRLSVLDVDLVSLA